MTLSGSASISARPSRRHWLGYLLLAPAVAADRADHRLSAVRVGRPVVPERRDRPARPAAQAVHDRQLRAAVRLRGFLERLLGDLQAGRHRERRRASSSAWRRRCSSTTASAGEPLARLLVALPWAVPEVIAVVIFAWIFDSSFGLMNWIFITLGLVDTTDQLVLVAGSAPSSSCASSWSGRAIPSSRSCCWPGCSRSRRISTTRPASTAPAPGSGSCTSPSHRLMPVLGVTLVLVMLWVFRDFSIIYVLTGGGPLKATQSLSIMTYEQAFGFFRMGYASAVGVVTLVICVVASRLMIGRAPDTMLRPMPMRRRTRATRHHPLLRVVAHLRAAGVPDLLACSSRRCRSPTSCARCRPGSGRSDRAGSVFGQILAERPILLWLGNSSPRRDRRGRALDDSVGPGGLQPVALPRARRPFAGPVHPHRQDAAGDAAGDSAVRDLPRHST